MKLTYKKIGQGHSKYKFTTVEYPKITATCKPSTLFMTFQGKVFENNELKYEIRQTNFLFNLFYSRGALKFGKAIPFRVFDKTGEIARSRLIFRKQEFRFLIKGELYFLRVHSGLKYSICKETEQITLISISDAGDINKLEVLSLNDEYIQIALLFLLAVHAMFFTWRAGRRSFTLFKDRYKYLADWNIDDL